jgi:hypothetical protein
VTGLNALCVPGQTAAVGNASRKRIQCRMHASPVECAAAPPDRPTLVRALGIRALAANIVNTIVGSGIFVLPAAVAAILGPAAVVGRCRCAVHAVDHCNGRVACSLRQSGCVLGHFARRGRRTRYRGLPLSDRAGFWSSRSDLVHVYWRLSSLARCTDRHGKRRTATPDCCISGDGTRELGRRTSP